MLEHACAADCARALVAHIVNRSGPQQVHSKKKENLEANYFTNFLDNVNWDCFTELKTFAFKFFKMALEKFWILFGKF